jgi:nucleotide-binding universal stress UspA family protein
VADLPRYRRILLATDGSRHAEVAEGHALALARDAGAVLTAVYVIDSPMAFRLGIHKDEALAEMRAEGRRALEAFGERAATAGVEHGVALGEGRPGQAILHEAETLPADLIVIGSQGQGALGDLLLGSVSQYVLHHARVPVCVVRPPDRR